MGSDAKKFNRIWEMNEDECKTLARSILDADQIITEQQLGLPWSPTQQYVHIMYLIIVFIS